MPIVFTNKGEDILFNAGDEVQVLNSGSTIDGKIEMFSSGRKSSGTFSCIIQVNDVN